jgi:hypothetical protein
MTLSNLKAATAILCDWAGDLGTVPDYNLQRAAAVDVLNALDSYSKLSVDALGMDADEFNAKIGMPNWAARAMAESFINTLGDPAAAPNVMELALTHEIHGLITVTIQRPGGKPQGQLLAEAKTQAMEMAHNLAQQLSRATALQTGLDYIAKYRATVHRLDVEGGKEPRAFDEAEIEIIEKIAAKSIERANELAVTCGIRTGGVEPASVVVP